jgi:hypothetical protein
MKVTIFLNYTEKSHAIVSEHFAPQGNLENFRMQVLKEKFKCTYNSKLLVSVFPTKGWLLPKKEYESLKNDAIENHVILEEIAFDQSDRKTNMSARKKLNKKKDLEAKPEPNPETVLEAKPEPNSETVLEAKPEPNPETDLEAKSKAELNLITKRILDRLDLFINARG